MSGLNITRPKRVVFLLSHPIQYFSPLFVEIAKQPDLNLLVLYCTDENIKGHMDQGFGVNVKWDIPLLDGYNYKFLKNNSWKPGLFKGFFGLINFNVIKVLFKERNSLVIIQGWRYVTNVLAIVFGSLIGCKVCVRGDNPVKLERLKSNKLLLIKKIILGSFLFKFIDYFLYVGKQNKEYYKFYGVPERKLIFTPHAVNNEMFRKEYNRLKDIKIKTKVELGLPIDKSIILFAGKLISIKRPMDLLEAYKFLTNNNCALVFVGDGELKNEMNNFISNNNLGNVFITGFINQKAISKYYSIADIFVLPSQSETWGLVINEAMNFALPILASDTVGAVDDLVVDGYNGYKFKCGNINDLSNTINSIINSGTYPELKENSLKIINAYSYKQIIKSLVEIN
jgi:glycosyltransferase involved in cell wall biosynthesis